MHYSARSFTFLLVFLLCDAPFNSAASQRTSSIKVNDPLSITLSASRDKFILGLPINVTIKVANTSDLDVSWESQRPDPAYTNFRFLLTANGVELPTTVYHRLITGKQLSRDPTAVWSGSAMFAKLTPGQSVQFSVDLTKLYVIPTAGEYVLSVQMFLNQSNKMPIRSKPLYLEVTRSQQPPR